MDAVTLSYFHRNISQQVIRGFSRSLAELDWLILALVLFYIQIAHLEPEPRAQVIVGMVVFAAFSLGFRYLGFFARTTRLKLTVETWMMLMFITWVIWHTGQIDSVLINLYLLAVVASALTLGRLITLLQITAVTGAYLYMSYAMYGEQLYSVMVLGRLMVDFAPFYLVAYVTTMLASDIQSANQLLKELSEKDGLTGLLNRGAFEDRLSKAISNPRRNSLPLCLMMIDSDHLKKVNDKFGHSAGDLLIQSIGTVLKHHVRPSDICGRYGGDEFLLLLGSIETADVRTLAERIRHAVANTPLFVDAGVVRSSVSIGCASYPSDAESTEELLNKADSALYKSKHGGRNRVTLSADISSSPSPDESNNSLESRPAISKTGGN